MAIQYFKFRMHKHKTIAIIAISTFLLAIFMIWLYHDRSERKQRGKIILYGNVDVRQVDLGFRVNGRIEAMPFEEGDFVRKGDLMAWIEKEPYLDQTIEAEASMEADRLNLENAELVYLRREELIDIGGVSVEDYQNALTSRDVAIQNLKGSIASLGVAKKNLNDTKLYAPSDGTILTRIREPGAVVMEGDPIYTLSLISPVWIRAYIPEPLLGVVKLGMTAEIFTDTQDGEVYTGKVGFISPVAEFTPKTVETTDLRTDLVYRIRIYADNPDWGLKQGMPVTVRLKNGKRSHPY